MKKICIFVFLLTIFTTNSTFAESLPEFFGSYLKKQDNSLVEISQNSSIGATGWFVKQPRSKDLNSMNKPLALVGDLGEALKAQSNRKFFLYNLSMTQIKNNELKGFIVYGEYDVNNIKIVKLSNQVIPSNAILASYSGPEPVDRNIMWFPDMSYDFKIKPLADKMYYLKTNESLTFGHYALVMGDKIADFEVLNIVSEKAIKKYSKGFSGVWVGNYICSQGSTGLTMNITSDSYSIKAIFEFYPLQQNSKAKSGSYSLTGQYSEDGSFVLQPKDWINRPEGYGMVGLSGKINDSFTELNGLIAHESCSNFQLRKQ